MMGGFFLGMMFDVLDRPNKERLQGYLCRSRWVRTAGSGRDADYVTGSQTQS